MIFHNFLSVVLIISLAFDGKINSKPVNDALKYLRIIDGFTVFVELKCFLSFSHDAWDAQYLTDLQQIWGI